MATRVVKGVLYAAPVSAEDLKVGDRVRHVDGWYGTVEEIVGPTVTVKKGRTRIVHYSALWDKFVFVRCVD